MTETILRELLISADHRNPLIGLGLIDVTEEILKELLVPANREILYFVLGFLMIVIFFLMGLAVYLARKGTLNAGRKIGPVYIQLSAAANSDQLARKAAGYRKLLYIKVTYLTQKTATARSIYTRTLDRLEPTERDVTVYDEALYYTLELFPSRRVLEARTDSSSGSVDARIVIPWQDNVRFQQDTTAKIAKIAQMDINDETDTVLSISHFLNGLQGDHQDFKSLVAEDCEEIRLAVDFSSIPGAEKFVTLKNAFLDRKADNKSLAIGGAAISPTLFVTSTKEGKKGDVLRLSINIDWNRVPQPTT
ncbi:MAG TPA: hypothetical protein VNU92_02290 [Edaphobacter sp.]|nr:hypothetical protein [Edaphobacter sp.]